MKGQFGQGDEFEVIKLDMKSCLPEKAKNWNAQCVSDKTQAENYFKSFHFEIYLKRQVIDFKITGEKPVVNKYEYAFIMQMDQTFSQGALFSLQRNIIKTSESWFHLVDSYQTKMYEYFNLGETRRWQF